MGETGEAINGLKSECLNCLAPNLSFGFFHLMQKPFSCMVEFIPLKIKKKKKKI